MELGFAVDVLAGGGVDGLPKMLVVNAGMGGLVSRAQVMEVFLHQPTVWKGYHSVVEVLRSSLDD